MPFLHDRHDVAPLYWLHGFTQTGRSAHQFRSILTARGEVHAPDLARHGSNWDRGGSLDEMADVVVASWPSEPVDLGGYSLGARVALHLALRYPERVRRLVLVGVTRGISDDSARRARVERDEALAANIEILGADRFIDEWLAQPMFAQLPVDAEEREARRGQHATSLAASLREAGTGTQRWLGDEIRTLAPRTLLLAGADDVRFALEALAISEGAPVASSQLIPGAGHAAHLHQPSWTARVVANFLDESVDEHAGSHQE